DASLFSLPLGPIRLTPQFRLGGEYRSDPPDDGLAGLAGIGFEVGFWLGRSLQVAVSWDRDFGFPSGTRNLSEVAIRWAHLPGPARLSDAAARGNRDEVRRLIGSGVRMDKDLSHEALHYAAGWCDRPMIEMIVAAWKGPADSYSELALHDLVRGCKPELTG